MTKIAILVLSSALLLSGCMTSQLAKQDPIFHGQSKKTPQRYTQCLAPKWQELNPAAKMVETETGYQLLVSDDWLGALSLAKIDSDNIGGTQVKIYAVSAGINNPWGKSGQSCL